MNLEDSTAAFGVVCDGSLCVHRGLPSSASPPRLEEASAAQAQLRDGSRRSLTGPS